MKKHIPHLKLIILCLLIAVAYVVFTDDKVKASLSGLDNLSYLGVLLGGILFSFGFTVPFAVGLFLTLEPQNIFLAAAIGGIGSMLGDMLILGVIKKFLQQDFDYIKQTKLVKRISSSLQHTMSKSVTSHLTYIVAGLIIALPIPDEIGLSLLAGFTHVRAIPLALVSFVLHAIGIFILLLI